MELGKPLFGYKINVKREIASLTKMMTLFTALDTVRERGLAAEQVSCIVSKYSASMNGTSAALRAGDEIKLKDIFYGTILINPSFDAS